jgi:hypothetical protein
MGRGARDEAPSQAVNPGRDPRITGMTLTDAIYYDTTGGAIERDFEPEQFETVMRRMDRLFKQAEANPTLKWLEYRRRQARLPRTGTTEAVEQILAWQRSGAPAPEPPTKPSAADRAMRRAMRRADRLTQLEPDRPRAARHLRAVPSD